MHIASRSARALGRDGWKLHANGRNRNARSGSIPTGGVEPLESRTLFAAVAAPALTLTLINADTGRPVPGVNFATGATLDLGVIGHHLSVRADPTAGSGAHSVRFNLDGNPNFRVENAAPYTINGDGNHGTVYYSWTPGLGTHTLVVTPYTASGATGAAMTSAVVSFTVVDSSPLPAPVRVNAGGPAYTDASGTAYAADSGFIGGQTATSTFAVAGTGDGTIYQTRRVGPQFTYVRGVPDGTYALSLDFAEPVYNAAGKRAFDVWAEGKQVLTRFDVFADVGAKAADVKTFTVNVVGGRLSLAFKADAGDAMVSGVELTPIDRRPFAPAPVRADAGGAALFDSLGRPFDADVAFADPAPGGGPGFLLGGFTGGTPGRTVYAVAGTNDAPLFDSYRSGPSFTFTRPIANGHYDLWLEFAEPDAAAVAGDRVFDVAAQGRPVLTHYDVTADAGPQTAVAKCVPVTVTDGRLSLSFTGVHGDAIISAIQLLPTDVPAAALPYSPVEMSGAAALVTSASNLRQIGQLILTYENENRGRNPSDFSTLTAAVVGGGSVALFADVRAGTPVPRGELTPPEKVAWVGSLNDYVYAGAALRGSSPPTSVVAYENPAKVAGDLNILFADGHVGTYSRADAAQFIPMPSTDPQPLPPPPPVTRDPRVSASAGNLRLIADDLFLYSNDNRGQFPPDLGTLYRAFSNSLPATTFINPRGTSSPPPPPAGATPDQVAAWINASEDYIFLAGGTPAWRLSTDAVIAYENPAAMAGGINLLFADGHVEFRETGWALETIAATVATGGTMG